ncbi:MAG: hypothetical protein DDT34_02118 [Firmicutes bacterium]|nr:hypothetical protein [Bacillota bacterium]
MLINTTARTISLVPGAGDLTLPSSGATGQALYSALKLLWKNSTDFIRFPFPMESITPEQFEFINGWKPANDTTRKAIRTAGWVERSAGGVIDRIYSGIVSLGSIALTDQPYFQLTNATTASTNFAFTGVINEAVQVFGTTANGDAGAGSFDTRNYFKLFVREQQKTYASGQLSDIGVTQMTYIVYRFPLSNAADLKVAPTDAMIIADTVTYGGINITYFAADQNRNIGGPTHPFRIIINGNNRTAEQIYARVQFLLRQNTDIDIGAGVVNGRTADALLRFVGDTLVTSTGVYIDNFNANDTNRIQFFDQSGTLRTFPFVAAGTLSFNTNLIADAEAIYRVFFTTLPGARNYGTANAIIVQDATSTPISGNISGASAIPFTFAYDSNVQGGRTVGTDAAVTVVAIGLSTGQFVSTTAVLTRATGQNISLVAPLERNFSNL